ncbi:MAG: hypothetical protein ACHQ01_00895 [Candidatus Limnocylindrales bacterium]
MAIAAATPEPDVGPQPVHQPQLAATRVSPPQTDHVAESKLDDFWLAGGHYPSLGLRDAMDSPITAAQSIRAECRRRGIPSAQNPAEVEA